jgi:hypothetical protein
MDPIHEPHFVIAFALRNRATPRHSLRVRASNRSAGLRVARSAACGAVAIACVALTLTSTSARAQAKDPAAEAPPPSTGPTAPPSPSGAVPTVAPDPFAGKTETEALAFVRALEARLSLGQAATHDESDLLVKAARNSPHTSVRALAVAVLAWLEPQTAVPPLLSAFRDPQERVRTTAAESLLSLARRLDDDQRRSSVSAALLMLDDPSDETACAAAELLGVLSPSAAADAVRTRGDASDDVRYACFARIGGLPLRPVNVPPLPSLEKPAVGPNKRPQPVVKEKTNEPADGTWLFVGTAAAAGLVAGGVLPSAFLPSRDVLLYTDTQTTLTHEEVAFPSQLGAGLIGAAALGGGAFALSTFGAAPNMDQAGVVAIGTGELGLVGASSQLAFGLKEGPADLATAAGLVAGTAASTGLAYAFFAGKDKMELAVDANVLSASFLGIGALTSGLVVFTATPVGYENVGSALRVDFGLGVVGMGAGIAGFGALATGAFLDVKPARSFILLAGASAGGGLALAGGFLFTPQSDVKSRIACGIGLGGEVIGFTAALFVPDEWLPKGPLHGAVGSAVRVDEGKVSLGIPVLVAIPGGMAANLVSAKF